MKRWIDVYIFSPTACAPFKLCLRNVGVIILSPQEASVEHSQEESRTELGKGKWPWACPTPKIVGKDFSLNSGYTIFAVGYLLKKKVIPTWSLVSLVGNILG